MRKTILLITTALSLNAAAQPFMRNQTGRPLTFREMQQQFADFRQKNDLSKTRHWKYFKRYETDMVRHTNGHGEPDGFSDFVYAAVSVSNQKQKSSANVWFPAGPSLVPTNLTSYMENGVGRINCVGFHPTDTNIFYVGVAQGGLWKTTNGGQSYTPLTDDLPITRISDIALDPTDPNTIYISVCDFEYVGTGLFTDGRKRHTHYGLGVYKSTDAGTTWQATGLTFQLTNGDASLIRKIVVSPDTPAHVLACGVSGMYKSTNGGGAWTKVVDSLFWDMATDPVHDSIVYAATGWIEPSNLGYAAIYKSTDFGDTWTMLNTGIPPQGFVQRIKLAVAPSDPDYLYALACDAGDGYYGMYSSNDAGASWTFIQSSLNILEAGDGSQPGGQGPYDMALCVANNDKTKLFTGGINVWSSPDGGSSFSPCSHWTFSNGPHTVHADIHAIQQQPVSGTYFVSCDGGLYRTKEIIPGSWGGNWTTQWENLSNGMQITSFYRLSGSRASDGRLVAGAQDNATFFYDGSAWFTIFGGDGMDNYIDPQDSHSIIGSSQYGNFYYTGDGGFSIFGLSTNPYFELCEWVTPIVADYNHPGRLFVGNQNVVVTYNGGAVWNPLPGLEPPNLTSTEICAMAVSPRDSAILYAGRRVRHELNRKAKVFISTDAGKNWSNVTAGLPDSLYITGIECSNRIDQEAAISFAGFSAGNKVFSTVDGGKNWLNISYNLPNVPVNCIKYVATTDQLVAACDVGIYVKNYGSTTWTLYSAGLPNVIVSDIEINEAANKMYISTFGRGIWQTNLAALKALQPVGLEEVHAVRPFDFKAYPTVGKGQLTIETEKPGRYELTVIDVMGRTVHAGEISETVTALDLRLPAGAYYLKISGASVFGVRKIVVE